MALISSTRLTARAVPLLDLLVTVDSAGRSRGALEASHAGILVVGPRFDDERNGDVHRVAVCIDSAAPDNAIVRDALGWADGFGVPLVVVTVQGRGRTRPGEDDTYHVLAGIFEDLPPAQVSVTAEALGDLDVSAAIVRFADRRPGTLLALAPGAADRAVHALTHRVTMQVACETRAPMLLRWYAPSADADEDMPRLLTPTGPRRELA